MARLDLPLRIRPARTSAGKVGRRCSTAVMYCAATNRDPSSSSSSSSSSSTVHPRVPRISPRHFPRVLSYVRKAMWVTSLKRRRGIRDLDEDVSEFAGAVIALSACDFLTDSRDEVTCAVVTANRVRITRAYGNPIVPRRLVPPVFSIRVDLRTGIPDQ